MTTFFVDLYAMTFAFYQARSPRDNRVYALAICVITGILALLNSAQIVEMIVGRKIRIPLNNQLETVIAGLGVFGIGWFCMRYFVSRHPVLQTSEAMCSHSIELSRFRKVGILATVITDLCLFIMGSYYVHKFLK
mgnify:CR=1 FL=1